MSLESGNRRTTFRGISYFTESTRRFVAVLSAIDLLTSVATKKPDPCSSRNILLYKIA